MTKPANEPCIAVDAMGADMGPAEVIAGVTMALQKNWLKGTIAVVGRPEELQPLLAANTLDANPRVRLQPASEVIGMDEKPIQSLRSKKDASMVRAIELVKQGEAAAAVSCGNTGALMACATLKLRPIEGVSKPALASVWPSRNKKFVVLDVGANPLCRPENLLHYAVLGNQYAQHALNISKPRVGLLSIGTEEGKGTELTNQAHELLKALAGQIHYVGLVEGFQLFNEEVDVVVTDGFTGNVVLKSCESLWRMMKTLLSEEVRRNPIRMLGALLLMGCFKSAKTRLDPKQYGGAPLLGLRGIVLKAHGSSNREAIGNAIRIAALAVEQKLHARTVDAIAKANEELLHNLPSESLDVYT